MLEKYKSDKYHFAIRLIFVLLVVIIFAIHSIAFINPNGRSCLGPPGILPFMFIGIPLIFVTLIIDIIILLFMKSFSLSKLFINLGLIGATFLLALLAINL
ncbi:MAG: hypothetical protein QM710_11125 [Flavobacterium sp.]